MEESKEIRIPDVGNIEELVCQPSIEVALEKMRNGVRMYLRDGAWDSIFELRVLKDLNGNDNEFVVEYENTSNYPINDFSSAKFWSECVRQFVGKKNLTLSPDEALELLKQGKPIITPDRTYFVGTINSPVRTLNDVKYVFVDYDQTADPGGIYIVKPLDDFEFIPDRRYGLYQE